MLRYFPIALHLRLFGAAGIGYVIGNFGNGASNLGVIVAAIAGVASIAGWWMMRPVMRSAKKDITAADHEFKKAAAAHVPKTNEVPK